MITDLVDNFILKKRIDIYDLLVGEKPYAKGKNRSIRFRSKYISLSADKARKVIDQIRGSSYEETLMALEL